jgi:hypothetical protein
LPCTSAGGSGPLSAGRLPGRVISVPADGAAEGRGGAEDIGGLAHEASSALAIIACSGADLIQRAAAFLTWPENVMTLLLLEALGALLLFVFIVWWTMFSGRHKGELRDEAEGASDRDDDQK